jgi:hypothetical protein
MVESRDEAFTNIPVIADQRFHCKIMPESRSLTRAYNAYNYLWRRACMVKAMAASVYAVQNGGLWQSKRTLKRCTCGAPGPRKARRLRYGSGAQAVKAYYG